MQTIVVAHGQPGSVAWREVAAPSPQPHEALVQVHASSLNRGEVEALDDALEGCQPGIDSAGVVLAAAADGSGPPVGARVLGLAHYAGWSQQVAIAARNLAILPDSVSFAQGAALPLASLAALRAVTSTGNVLGKQLLVVGMAGGVGHFAAQLATLAGADVTGIVRHPEQLAGWDITNAVHVVSSTQELAGRFDRIIELVGGSAINAVLPYVADEGIVLLMKGYPQADVLLDMTPFLRRWNAQLRTLFLYSPTSGPEHVTAELAHLARLVASGNLQPHLGWQGSWRQLPDAIAAMRGGRVPGKAVFTIADA